MIISPELAFQLDYPLLWIHILLDYLLFWITLSPGLHSVGLPPLLYYMLL